MVQWIKALATNPDDPSLIPGMSMVGGYNKFQVVLISTCVQLCAPFLTWTSANIIKVSLVLCQSKR